MKISKRPIAKSFSWRLIGILVTWMSSNPLKPRTKVIIKHTTNQCPGMVKGLKYKIDINTLHRL